jgi:hypothetical protein
MARPARRDAGRHGSRARENNDPIARALTRVTANVGLHRSALLALRIALTRSAHLLPPRQPSTRLPKSDSCRETFSNVYQRTVEAMKTLTRSNFSQKTWERSRYGSLRVGSRNMPRKRLFSVSLIRTKGQKADRTQG